MIKKQKILILIIVIAVLAYGAYVYYDRFWERKADPDAEYNADFENDQNKNQQKDDAKENENAEENSEIPSLNAEEKEEENDANNTDCESKAGTVRDECFKNKAVDEKNDSICDSISDSTVKQDCINAVGEAVLDSF